MVVKTAPENGYASISTVDLEFVGLNAVTGMPKDNEKRCAAGLCSALFSCCNKQQRDRAQPETGVTPAA